MDMIAQPPLPTVKIVSDDTPDGFVIVNKSDFDPKIHKLYKDASSKSDKQSGDEK